MAKLIIEKSPCNNKIILTLLKKFFGYNCFELINSNLNYHF